MGVIGLFLMALVPYYLINRLGRKNPRMVVLIPAVIIGVPITVALGMAAAFQLYELGHPLREIAIGRSLGMGFWFALFGSVAGAFDGRRRAKKRQKEEAPASQN